MVDIGTDAHIVSHGLYASTHHSPVACYLGLRSITLGITSGMGGLN